MSLLWLESEGKREKEQGVLWVLRVEPWLPAELSSQVGHMAWEDQLGAAAPNVARVTEPSASTLACSHQPVLGRHPWLLQWLQLGLLPMGVRLLWECEKCGLLGHIQRSSGALPRQVSSRHAEVEGVRTRVKSQVNLWKCFWMTNTKRQGPSCYYSIFWVYSQFELHPSGWWGVWET